MSPQIELPLFEMLDDEPIHVGPGRPEVLCGKDWCVALHAGARRCTVHAEHDSYRPGPNDFLVPKARGKKRRR